MRFWVSSWLERRVDKEFGSGDRRFEIPNWRDRFLSNCAGTPYQRQGGAYLNLCISCFSLCTYALSSSGKLASVITHNGDGLEFAPQPPAPGSRFLISFFCDIKHQRFAGLFLPFRP